MKRQRRLGATETFSVSVDPETKRRLKMLAEEAYGGNVSALVTDLALRAERAAAFARAWAWYGGAEPTAEESAAIRREWEDGWKVARERGSSRTAQSRPRAQRAHTPGLRTKRTKAA